ncbi:MAG TPA: serine/threonine-protein kinase, partial [Myxococcaceae bacterium]
MSDAERWQRVKDVFDAALQRPAAERAAFLGQACGDDGELVQEVQSLLRAHEDAGSFLSVPVLATWNRDWTGRRVGPYRVLGEIGHGGMGVVYRATRDDDVFQKIVALKVVHGDAGPEAARRFARERRILARLQHPNIATILDGGETEDGWPYLVMEHVEGQAIDVFCESRTLDTRQRLELFRTVCGAVHYAHQNLIVHRDLKPANILVTADGQPKLLDFGIAALLAPDDPTLAPTMTVPAMTPSYASPEQIRGLPLTTASDVYSLGVIAYELLTGELPLRVRASSLEEMVRTVCDTEPPPPSTVIRGGGTSRPPVAASILRGDLDTIVLKALRKEPSRRYLSAQMLAEDMERFLAGRPVRAQKDTPGYRLRKFVGRHRAGVVAAAAVVVSVVGGLLGVVHQARIAEANRLRAERRFADVRRMANSLLFELHDAVKDLPGSTAARSLVLRRALEYLDGLSQEAAGDPKLQEELATAYQRVAEVQGSPSGANLGDPAGAAESLRKELALRQTLAARSPADARLGVAAVATARRLSLLEDEIGQTQRGRDRLARALSTIEDLVARAPGAMEARREAARVHRDLGLLLFKTGDRSSATEHQRRSLAAWKAERDAHPDDADVLRELYLVSGDLARSLEKAGARTDALEHHRGAVAA